MVLDTFLKELKIEYKEIEYDDYAIIYKLKLKVNLVYMKSRSSSFSIDRDLFFYLVNQKQEYHFLLDNNCDDKIFFLPYNKFASWLKGSFDSSDKDELYFGKVVLQNELSQKQLTSHVLNMVK